MKMFYNVANSLICCAKEARASIVLNIEWVEFVLQNCEMSVWWKNTMFSRSGGHKKKPTPLDRGPPLHVNRVL